MAGLGSLVDAHFRPPRAAAGAGAAADVPDGYVLMSRYDGPGGPLTVARAEDDGGVWIGGGALPEVRLPWGPADLLTEPGGYERARRGVRSDPGGLDLTARMLVQGKPRPRPIVRIEVEDGSVFVLRQPRMPLRSPRLEREGRLIATRFLGAKGRITADATSLDALVTALVWASVLSMVQGPSLLALQEAVPELP